MSATTVRHVSSMSALPLTARRCMKSSSPSIVCRRRACRGLVRDHARRPCHRLRHVMHAESIATVCQMSGIQEAKSADAREQVSPPMTGEGRLVKPPFGRIHPDPLAEPAGLGFSGVRRGVPAGAEWCSWSHRAPAGFCLAAVRIRLVDRREARSGEAGLHLRGSIMWLKAPAPTT
jgi:hypothetical protein